MKIPRSGPGYHIKNFIIKGQIIPSSTYLVNRMVSKLDFSKDLKILQLGFGTGVFTKEILKRMNKESKLTVFEIRKECREHYESIKEDRLTYIEDSAEKVFKYFENKKFDYILSTLPFTHFPKKTQNAIYHQIKTHLARDGKYLQYQYSLLSKRDIKKLFNKEPKIDFEFFNLPPAFIYEVEN